MQNEKRQDMEATLHTTNPETLMDAIEAGRHNGFPRAIAVSGEGAGSDWRLDTIDQMLRNASEDGTPVYVLLEAVRKRAGERAVRTFNDSRSGILAAFGRVLLNFTPQVLPAQYHTDDDDEVAPVSPIFGWWKGSDTDGNAFEVVIEPGFYNQGRWAVIGPNPQKVQALIERVTDEAHKFRSRCRRFAGGWEDDPKMEAEVARVAWDDVILAPETIGDIQNTIKSFFAQREVFSRLGFAWRRGILLIGPPGTGKTMVCKAAAHAYPDIPFLYVGDVGRRSSNAEIEQVFEHARKSAPCILAFEDLDGLIDKGTRTLFLNELDGFRPNDGLLIIASSNHPERIDEALLKRPSRFDRVYHIGLPARTERFRYSKQLLERSPVPGNADFDLEALASRVADASEGFTPAFLKEAFLSAMLAEAQAGHTEMTATFGDSVMEQVDALKRYLKKARNPEVFAEMASSSQPEIGFRAR